MHRVNVDGAVAGVSEADLQAGARSRANREVRVAVGLFASAPKLIVWAINPLTLSHVEPVKPETVAEMVVEPLPTAWARPEALIVATDELDEAHVAVEVRSSMWPSE
jgi:hypothetical protein